MKLTDNEIRDITQHLEAGKSLPDKYRFLLFEDKKEVELVWNGKSGEISNVVLPFQTIEQVDEPRAEAFASLQIDLFDLQTGRQIKGWNNKLIWGDNKLILSSLKNGPLREEINKQGGIKLIYIDPPFDVGADFSMDIEIGGETLTKKPSVLEEIAYRDTWGKGADSFISMIYERLVLMRDLLAEDGLLFLHIGWNISHHVRLVLDEIFGAKNFINQIIWRRQTAHSDTGQGSRHLGRIHDIVLLYSKSAKFTWNMQYLPYSEEYVKAFYKYIEPETGRKYRLSDATGPGGASKGNPSYEFLGVTRFWRFKREKMEELYQQGRIVQTKPGNVPQQKRYLDEMPGVPLQDLWLDINTVQPQAHERTGYSTQKPINLLERILLLGTNENDLIADFFCGSGTTAAVAEKLGRKWIASDLGKFAIHTTRKRLIGVQRGLKAEDKSWRAFEILNLGKYERQHYIGLNPDLRAVEKQQQLQAKEKAFLELILHAYRAEAVSQFNCFQGKKAGRLVAVGPINLPVTRLFVEEIVLECRQKHITKVDILGFAFEMGLFPTIQDEAKSKGIDLAMKYIPRDVFDKRAVEKNQVVFHDVSFIEVKPHFGKGKNKHHLAIELTDFSVFYCQDSVDAGSGLKNKKSKVIVDQGQVVKISKDKDGIISRELLTQQWTDWIDYWSVDFDFESKQEILRVKNEISGDMEAVWTGDYVFENEWQSFRTKKDRSLKMTSTFVECVPGRRKIAVKVVDIFGNDTMKIIEVSV